MARANNANINEALQQHCAVLCHCNGGRDVKEAGTQTDSKVQGENPSLNRNLE